MGWLPKTLIRVALLAALTPAGALWVGFLARPAVVPPTDQGVTLDGAVEARFGTPVANATVKAFALAGIDAVDRQAEHLAARTAGEEVPLWQPTASVRTDDRGRYRMRFESPGIYLLEVKAPGYFVSPAIVPVLENRGLPPLIAVPARRVRLRVRDEDGQPIGTAIGYTQDWSNQSGSSLFPASSAATRDGSIDLELPKVQPIAGERPPGGFVYIVASGYAPQRLSFQDLEQSSLTLILQRKRGVALRLLEPGGAPAASATLALDPGPVFSVATAAPAEGREASGIFEVPFDTAGFKAQPGRSPTGNLTITVRSASGAVARARIGASQVVPLNGETSLEDATTIQLEEASSWRGRVVEVQADGDQEGVPGAWLYFGHAGAFPADPSGHFDVAVSPRRRTLNFAAAPGYGRQDVWHVDPTGENLFELQRERRVTGTVRHQGDPLPGAALEAQTRAAWTNERGEYSLALGSGATAVRVAAPGIASESFDVPAFQPSEFERRFDIDVASAVVGEGWVVDPSGNAVSGAEVTLSEWSATKTRRREAMAFATSDADGYFLLEGLTPGTVEITVYTAEWAPATVPGVEVPPAAELAPDAIYALGTVTLAPAVAIEGRVIDSEEQPIREVAVRSYARGSERNDQLQTDHDGRFRLEGLAEGDRVQLDFRSPGWVGKQMSDVVAGEGVPLEVVMLRGASFKVVVVSETGAGIENAAPNLQFLSPSANGRTWGSSGLSDAEGKLVVSDLEPGKWKVAMSAPGYVAGEGQVVDLQGGEETDLGRVVLGRGATIYGQMRNPEGEPVTGDVSSDRARHRFGFPRRLEKENPREGADYEIDGLPTGRSLLTANAENYVAKNLQIDLTPGEHRIDWVLEPSPILRGVVLRSDGEPVPGATVSIRKRAASGGMSGRGLRTEADGTFEYEVTPGERYSVRASKDGVGLCAELDIEIGRDPIDFIQLLLRPGGTITGEVIGADVDAFARALVAVRPLGEPWWGRHLGSVDWQGKFRVSPLPAEALLVKVTLDERSLEKTVDLGEGGEEFLEFDFGDLVEITGTVLGALGEPATNLMVGVQGQRQETTDSQGHFSLFVQPGPVRIEVSDFNGPLLHRDVEVQGGEDLLLELPAQRITGVITDEAGEPLLGALVTLLTAGEPSPRWGRRATTEVDGTFSHEGLAAGTYQLTAGAEGHRQEVRLVELNEGEASVEIALGPEVATWVEVRGARGAPPVAVHVEAYDDQGRRVGQESSRVEASTNRAPLLNLPTGRWTALITDSHQQVAVAELVISEPAGERAKAAATATMAPGASIEVRMADGPRRRALTSLRLEHQRIKSLRPLEELRLLGAARIGPLVAGTWRVVVAEHDGSVIEASVELVPGQSRVIELE